MPTADTVLAALGWSPAPNASPPVPTADPVGDAVEPAKPARRRRVAPVVPPRPAPPHAVLHDNRPVMSVALVGDLARGRRFVLDILAWERVTMFLGPEWTVREPAGPDGPAYVTSGRVKARAIAQRTTGNVVLARWLARAEAGQVVSYRNGNTLDLTGRNLVLEDRKEHFDAHRVRTGRAGRPSAETHQPS